MTVLIYDAHRAKLVNMMVIVGQGGQCTGSCAAAVSRLTGPSRELHCS